MNDRSADNPPASRGVDVDAICIAPSIDHDVLAAAVDEILGTEFNRLNSIDDVQLDTMLEWCKPSERCIAVTRSAGMLVAPLSSPDPNHTHLSLKHWQVVYDTRFSHAALADGLSRRFPDSTIIQFNLQEEVDLTLRILRYGAAVYEFSNAPSFFNWGRCIGKNEPETLARLDFPALVEACGCPMAAPTVQDCHKTISAKTLGQRKHPKGKHSGGVYDAMQSLASEMGLPRLYRFFEGWMKSDLDWDEDNVAQVWAYRRRE